jgi:uncharacterized protein (TIGR00661 family)
MARILYGISGDGFGHAARSQEVIRHLQSEGHQLLLVSYDKGYQMLSKSFSVRKISGLSLQYESNEVKYLGTITKNILNSRANLQSLDKVLSLTKKFKPDLVITDFEPTVTLTANWLGLPLISLDNMHVITKTRLEVPEKWRTSYLTTKLIIRLMVINASRYLILSFFPAPLTSDKAQLVPPLVRQEILQLKASLGQHILVYLTAANQSILPVLQASGANYIIYGLGKRPASGNLCFKDLGAKDYLKDLASAQAIIATAGFSLISEALYLGKPYLALPIKSQFEQLINAHYLQKLGYGLLAEKFDAPTLAKFLKNLDKFRRKLSGYKPTGNAPALAAVDQAIKELL